MTGIQNIINRLQYGEIIELLDENQKVKCLQYRIEDNTYVIYDKNFHSFIHIHDDLEMEKIIRSHFEGKDLLN